MKAILDNALILLPTGKTRAGAIGWEGDRIATIGDGGEVRQSLGPRVKVMDIKGALVLPGLWDCHTHMLWGAMEKSRVWLYGVRSREEFTERVRRWAELNPQEPWILGGGWNENLWGGEPPSRDWVDGVTGKRPLFLLRCDLHSALVNTAALELAQITDKTPDPPGGRIVRDAEGRPTGRLLERAVELIENLIPSPSNRDKQKLLARALSEAGSFGLVGLHDLVSDFHDVHVYRELFERGGPFPRVLLRTPLEQLKLFIQHRNDPWPDGLWLHGVKGFLDGSLGSLTAWMREPYLNMGPYRGVSSTSDPERLKELIWEAASRDVPLSLHAIGDAAIGLCLEEYWNCIRKGLGRAYLRIEHLQHPSPTDLEAMDHPRLIASMQPSHILGDARPAEERLGRERARWSFPLRTLLEKSCTVIFGSDWPVSSINPFLGIQAAVTRQDAEGRWPSGWVPEERIGILDALRCYTASPARVSGMGLPAGELRPGYIADLTVVDRDITSCPESNISRAKVLMTVVGGKVIYEDL